MAARRVIRKNAGVRVSDRTSQRGGRGVTAPRTLRLLPDTTTPGVLCGSAWKLHSRRSRRTPHVDRSLLASCRPQSPRLMSTAVSFGARSSWGVSRTAALGRGEGAASEKCRPSLKTVSCDASLKWTAQNVSGEARAVPRQGTPAFIAFAGARLNLRHRRIAKQTECREQHQQSRHPGQSWSTFSQYKVTL